MGGRAEMETYHISSIIVVAVAVAVARPSPVRRRPLRARRRPSPKRRGGCGGGTPLCKQCLPKEAEIYQRNLQTVSVEGCEGARWRKCLLYWLYYTRSVIIGA